MKLSAEQFAELSSTFNAEASKSRHERRRAPRMTLQARMSIEPIVAGQRQATTPVVVCDFSSRGVAYIASAEIELGRQFVLKLPRKAGGSVSLLCTVAHIQRTGPSTWRIGAEFTCTLHAAEEFPASAAADDAERKRISESMLG